jgi:hypothetical protein
MGYTQIPIRSVIAATYKLFKILILPLEHYHVLNVKKKAVTAQKLDPCANVKHSFDFDKDG